MFPSGSPPTFRGQNFNGTFSTAQTFPGFWTWFWRWERQTALTPNTQAYITSSPVRKGRDAMRNRLKRRSILEKLWCQLSVFPRDPLKSPSFGVVCVEGKHTNTSRISFKWQCCNVTLMIADVSISKRWVQVTTWFPKDIPRHPSFFRIKSKMASNTWLRLLQISPQNQQGRRGTVGAEECMALPSIKGLAAPHTSGNAFGSRKCADMVQQRVINQSQCNWTLPLLLN